MAKALYLKLIVVLCGITLIHTLAEDKKQDLVPAAPAGTESQRKAADNNKPNIEKDEESEEIETQDDNSQKSKTNDLQQKAGDGEFLSQKLDERADGGAAGGEQSYESSGIEPPSSSFVLYFALGSIFVVGGYIGYNRRKKLMGVLVEGWNKKERRQVRRGGGGGGHGQAYNRVSESEPVDEA